MNLSRVDAKANFSGTELFGAVLSVNGVLSIVYLENVSSVSIVNV